MIQLKPTIDRIRALLDQDTDASVTYAALEARLALEKFCYDRLRQRHDYISHADLRAWTPRHVVKRVMEEVDENLGQTMTLSISRSPARDGVNPADEDYVEIGTEIGFKPHYIAGLWQALSNLALHVRVPEHKDDRIPDYGDKAQTRAKVDAVVAELERLAKGTMTFSGLGEEVSFDCGCGQKNKRRAGLLKHGQSVSCYSENCSRSYKVAIEDDRSFRFELDSVEIPCEACGKLTLAPRKELLKMDYEQPKIVKCKACSHENHIQWILARVSRDSTRPSATKL